MVFNEHYYASSDTFGTDFIFAMMWHTSPARRLDVTKPDDVILAVNNAYRDMMPRTINGIGLSNLDKIPAKTASNSDKQALRNVKSDLLNELRTNLAKNIIDKVFHAKGGIGAFNDTIHEALCNEFIKDFTAKIKTLNMAIDNFNLNHPLSKNQAITSIDPAQITYGKAQKIVNMSMKLLYCFDNAHIYKTTVFQNCHIPIDSIILKFFRLNSSYVWSNLTPDKYREVQDECKKQWENKINAAGLLPTDDMRYIFFAEFLIWNSGKTIDTITILP